MTPRRVGLFRALLTAHAQMMINRTRKGLGRRGIIGLTVVIVIMLAAAAPMFMTFGFLGSLFGRGIDKPLAAPLMGGILLAVSLGIGLVGGLLGGARQLTWDAYRSFPVPFTTLFFAETFASLGDLLVLGFVGMVVAMGAAFIWQRPALAPLVLLLLGQVVLWVLFLQHLVGTLAVTAVRRLRRAMVFLMVAAWAGVTVVAGLAREIQEDIERDRIEHIRAAWHQMQPAMALLPPVRAVDAMIAARQGELLRCVWLELPMLGVTLALGLLSYALLRRESRPSVALEDVGGGRAEPLRWTGVAFGVARLHIHQVSGSLQGRFGLVVPLITVVLIKGPLGTVGVSAKYTVPGAVLYLALAATQFYFNQWGFDGQGVKTLFLLPIRMRDLLIGKTLALLVYCVFQNALLLALLALLVHPDARELVAGALLGGCLFVAYALEGQWVSALYPRPLAMHRMNPTGLSATSLLPLGVGMANSTVFGATYSLVEWLAPRAVIPMLVVLLGVLVALYRMLLPATGRFVEEHRENLVEVLG